MTRTLEEVLESLRADAKVLRRHGHAATADLLERVRREVEEAAGEWLTFLSETEAKLRSGHGTKWLADRRRVWAAEGHARKSGGHWQYRACVVPRRPQSEVDAYEAGRRAGGKGGSAGGSGGTEQRAD